jgi:dihydropyrimidinase
MFGSKDKFVIPGGIDPHTHMQLPFMGTKAVDDFNKGSKAALAGGTTCFIDFVIPDKNESLLKAYERWRGWADPQVNCDYTFHCAITTWNNDIKREMTEMVNRGISSFKVFLAYKGALMLNDGEFYKVLDRCKELGAICLIHAENGDILYETQKHLLKMGITGPEGHCFSRPEDLKQWQLIKL